MSEYWKSIPKYWCKHCHDFATDTPLGRKNHEATAKHQSALKRFLRDLHRENERTTAATANAKREVARLNALVAGPSGSTGPAPTVAKPELTKGERWGVADRPLTEDEKKRQMKELEALGVAMPETYRGDLALPGEWTTVSVEVGKKPLTEKELLKKEIEEQATKEREAEERKRKWEMMDEDDKAVKGFKIQERTYPGDEGDVDVAVLFGKKGKKIEVSKVKKEQEEESENKPLKFAVKKEGTERVPAALQESSEMGAAVKAEDGTTIKREPEENSPEIAAAESDAAGGKTGIDIPIKKEDEEANAAPAAVGDGVVFKKRKVKAMRKKD